MKRTFKKTWPLGFLGILCLLAIPQYAVAGWMGLSWLLWAAWFIHFIPNKQK